MLQCDGMYEVEGCTKGAPPAKQSQPNTNPNTPQRHPALDTLPDHPNPTATPQPTSHAVSQCSPSHLRAVAREALLPSQRVGKHRLPTVRAGWGVALGLGGLGTVSALGVAVGCPLLCWVGFAWHWSLPSSSFLPFFCHFGTVFASGFFFCQSYDKILPKYCQNTAKSLPILPNPCKKA